jgi:hypothetical protein
MQCRERQLHLCLDTDDLRDTESRCLAGDVLQEGRLTHARLATDHQDRARPPRTFPNIRSSN